MTTVRPAAFVSEPVPHLAPKPPEAKNWKTMVALAGVAPCDVTGYYSGKITNPVRRANIAGAIARVENPVLRTYIDSVAAQKAAMQRNAYLRAYVVSLTYSEMIDLIRSLVAEGQSMGLEHFKLIRGNMATKAGVRQNPESFDKLVSAVERTSRLANNGVIDANALQKFLEDIG